MNRLLPISAAAVADGAVHWLTSLVPIAGLTAACIALGASCSTEGYVREADEEVYTILEKVASRVTGERKVFAVERPVDTLRARLLAAAEAAREARDPAAMDVPMDAAVSAESATAPIELSLLESLDIAAENSREFRTQRERLYLSALALTTRQHDFAVRWGGGGGASIDGTGDGKANTNASLSDDLSASVNTTSGGRLVASFVNTFLRSLINGGDFEGNSILSLTFTQPLLRGFGEAVVREPLTQSERNVVYAMRDFERFRRTFAIRVVSDYLRVCQSIADLQSEDANLISVQRSAERTDALFESGRADIIAKDRASQSVLTAENRKVNAINSLATQLDRFKVTLGLPVEVPITLDERELQSLTVDGSEDAFQESVVTRYALENRFDLRTVRDQVADSARQIVVAENALQSGFDFTSAISIPTRNNESFDFDWSNASWSAGFDLNLALDRLVERNAYRSSLIAFDQSVRDREALRDSIVADVRLSLRNIATRIESYRIQRQAVTLAERRVDSAEQLFAATRADFLDVIDAKNDFLSAQLSLTAALVDYTIARLELFRDLEAITMEPKGLRFDAGLPYPPPQLPDTRLPEPEPVSTDAPESL